MRRKENSRLGYVMRSTAHTNFISDRVHCFLEFNLLKGVYKLNPKQILIGSFFILLLSIVFIRVSNRNSAQLFSHCAE